MEKAKYLDHLLIKMLKVTNKYFILVIITLFVGSNNVLSNIEHKIAVLVNEEIITSYDIIQRLKLNAIIKGNNLDTQNNQLLLNNTVDELIQEKLRQEKIYEYKIDINDEEYKRFETSFFERNNIIRDQMLVLLSKNNIKYDELKIKLINELSWSKLISGLFYRLTSVSDIEVDEIIKKNPNISNDQAQNFVIQRQLDLQSSKLLRDMMNEATIEYK